MDKPNLSQPPRTETSAEPVAEAAPPSVGGVTDPQEEVRWAAAAHLSVLVGLVGIPGLLGPLVIWLIKKGESEFLDAQAKEALNFSLSLAIYIVALVALIIIVSINESVAGIVLFSLALAAALITGLILPIVAGVKAANGDSYRYPLTLRLVK